jgi:hypothetical protein
MNINFRLGIMSDEISDRRYRQRWMDGTTERTMYHTITDLLDDIAPFLSPTDLERISDVIREMPLGATLDLSATAGSLWTIERVK